MWISERSAGVTAMNSIRKKLRRRTRNAFSSGKKASQRREPMSERVDWEFVCFPPSTKAPVHQSIRPPSPGTSRPEGNSQLVFATQEPPLAFYWNGDVQPRKSWSFATPQSSERSSPPPPPVPPRSKSSSSPSPALPPRPASLHSNSTSSGHNQSLILPGNGFFEPQFHKQTHSPIANYCSSEWISPLNPQGPSDDPPPVPRHMHVKEKPSRRMPLSPSALPPAPNVSPIRCDPISPLYAKPSHFLRNVTESLQRSFMADKDAFLDEAASTSGANNDFNLNELNFKPLDGIIGFEDPNSSLPHSIKYFNLGDSCAYLSQCNDGYAAVANKQLQSNAFYDPPFQKETHSTSAKYCSSEWISQMQYQPTCDAPPPVPRHLHVHEKPTATSPLCPSITTPGPNLPSKRHDPVSPLYAKPSHFLRNANRSLQKSKEDNKDAFLDEALSSSSDPKTGLDLSSFNFKSIEGDIIDFGESNPSLACSINSFNLDNSSASLTQSFEFKFLPKSSDHGKHAFENNCEIQSGCGPSWSDINSQSVERMSLNPGPKLPRASQSKHSSLRPSKKSSSSGNRLHLSRDLESILDKRTSIPDMKLVKSQKPDHENQDFIKNIFGESCNVQTGDTKNHSASTNLMDFQSTTESLCENSDNTSEFRDPIENSPCVADNCPSRSALDSPTALNQEAAGEDSCIANPPSTSSSATLVSTPPASSDSLHFQHDPENKVDIPDWRLSLSPEELKNISPKEKKRQDIIQEFFYTELNHVENLKWLDQLFFKPMNEAPMVPAELTNLLFPNFDQVVSLHKTFSQKMKDKMESGYPIVKMGDILLEMFEGSNGDCLIQVGSKFIRNQKFSIGELKNLRIRDQKLDTYLAEKEGRPECKSLQLQSMLLLEHQHLKKYPQSLEQLLKQTDKHPQENEYKIVKKCLGRTLEILESIDLEVAEAHNIQILAEIQNNLDTSALEELSDSSLDEYKFLDLTKYRLIFDGQMTLKIGSMKAIKLHVLLLEDCLMFMQKKSEKYILKFITSSSGSSKVCHSPVLTFDNCMIRTVATDKKALNLTTMTEKGPQVYKLIAASIADRAEWFLHISEAIATYKENNPSIDLKSQPSKSDQMDSDTPKPEVDDSAKDQQEGQLETQTRPSLINPSEVVVSQMEVLVADSVLCPLERLRRKDLEVAKALQEKQALIAEILHIPKRNFELITDMACQQVLHKDAKEVLLFAIEQGKQLSHLVNTSLTLHENDLVASSTSTSPSTCPGAANCLRMQADKLIEISTNINLHLTSLLSIITESDGKIDHLKEELQRSKDQLNALLIRHICTDCYPTSTFNISIIENNLGGEHVSKMNDGDDSGSSCKSEGGLEVIILSQDHEEERLEAEVVQSKDQHFFRWYSYIKVSIACKDNYLEKKVSKKHDGNVDGGPDKSKEKLIEDQENNADQLPTKKDAIPPIKQDLYSESS